MPPRLPGLPTFAALLLSVLITIWLGLWGPFFSIELKSLNDSPGFAAWAQAVVASVAMLVVYISATMPMRTEAAERATERRVRAEGLALLLFSDVLVLKGEIEDYIQNCTIYDVPVEAPATLVSKTDQLYLLGEWGGRLLQAIGMVNGVAAQTKRYQRIATVNGAPIQSRMAAGVPIWQNNVNTLQLCLMNLDEFIEYVQTVGA
jgi:hypothetical protein